MCPPRPPHRRRLQPRRMKAASVADDAGVQAARSQLLSDDSSSRGRGEEGGAGGHREVSSHRGDGCAAGKSVRGCVRGCAWRKPSFWIFFSSLMELDLPVDAHLNVSSDISSPPVKYGPFRRPPPPPPPHLPSSVMNGSGLCLLSRLEAGKVSSCRYSNSGGG